ncbi:MAG TPA: RNase adapter RapZ [Lachnospiraceae bacterium]
MRLVIVTGMSGAGKSVALNVLEDAGYFCVDNLPISLMEKFLEISLDKDGGAIDKIALGIDARGGEEISRLKEEVEKIRKRNIQTEILYLDADDQVLVKRYKETRRNHPLSKDARVHLGIAKERMLMAPIRENADYILDTSQLLTRELKRELEKIFLENRKFHNMIVTILSFGFKYGIPTDCDLVFDVRFLPNPYYVDGMRLKTGNEKEVYDYVMSSPQAGVFLHKLEDMVRFLIPNYIGEGKNQVVIGIGCTGGKHRSVTLSNALFECLGEGFPFAVKLEHRDIEKDSKR